jgi:tRNA(Arg) A34 adenosine deaminase TadA
MDFTISLPDWAEAELANAPEFLPKVEDRMALVIKFSRLNFQNGTGGPFAAGIFERASGKLVMMGVNRVVPTCCSSAHGEVVALSLAQKKLGTFDLGGADQPEHEIVINWNTCAMCYGAVLWSGIRSVVIAGSGPEMEEITGFDEGPLHPDWRGEYARRGIDFQEGILREEALDAFREFAASGALVYNGRSG